MPKIIQNLREQLLAETQKQIAERGYASTTVRSVANACGVGVGTVYNYFETKEMLVASFVLEKWKTYLDAMATLPSDDPRCLLAGIYDLMKRFAVENVSLFSDPDATKQMALGSPSRHKMLRAQIAAYVLPICEGEAAQFAAEFIAEALIAWSMENADFEAVYPLLKKIIQK